MLLCSVVLLRDGRLSGRRDFGSKCDGCHRNIGINILSQVAFSAFGGGGEPDDEAGSIWIINILYRRDDNGPHQILRVRLLFIVWNVSLGGSVRGISIDILLAPKNTHSVHASFRR